MESTTVETADWLICTCCGKGVLDTPEHNVSHGTSQFDTGYGMCRDCGGDEKIEYAKSDRTIDEAALKKRMGWAKTTFVEARFDVVRKNLNAANQARWDTLTYARKCIVVLRMVKQGLII